MLGGTRLTSYIIKYMKYIKSIKYMKYVKYRLSMLGGTRLTSYIINIKRIITIDLNKVVKGNDYLYNYSGTISGKMLLVRIV